MSQCAFSFDYKFRNGDKCYGNFLGNVVSRMFTVTVLILWDMFGGARMWSRDVQRLSILLLWTELFSVLRRRHHIWRRGKEKTRRTASEVVADGRMLEQLTCLACVRRCRRTSYTCTAMVDLEWRRRAEDELYVTASGIISDPTQKRSAIASPRWAQSPRCFQ